MEIITKQHFLQPGDTIVLAKTFQPLGLPVPLLRVTNKFGVHLEGALQSRIQAGIHNLLYLPDYMLDLSQFLFAPR